MTSKRPTEKRRISLQLIEKVAESFHILPADHLELFCKSPYYPYANNTHILAIADCFTKYVWLETVPNSSAQNVCNCIE